MAGELGDHLDLRPEALDPRRADEDRADGLLPQAVDPKILFEAVQLAPEGVAATGVVGETEMLAVRHDHAGAAAHDRAPGVVKLADGGVQAVPRHAFGDRG